MNDKVSFCSKLLAICLVFILAGWTCEGQHSSAAAAGAVAAARAAAKSKQDTEISAAMQTADDRAADETRLAGAQKADHPDATLLLHEGDPLTFKLLHELKSNTASMGEPVQLALENDLVVEGKVVAKANTRALGEVVWAAKHTAQLDGVLVVRVDSLRIGDRKVLLRGSLKLDKSSGILFSHDVTLKEGTILKAFVADDIKLPPVL